MLTPADSSDIGPIEVITSVQCRSTRNCRLLVALE